jgi:signal transduction histidine kinase
MIDVKNFAKYITEIFNSEYSQKLKYDQTARLVCNDLDASTVSLLLYDSKQDALVCRGFYLNQKTCNFAMANSQLETILKEVGAFEFMKFKNQPKGNSDCSKLFRDYNQTFTFFKRVKQEQFLKICAEFKESVIEYDRYKAFFPKEKYEINKNTITGEYFMELLKESSTSNIRMKICDLSKYNPEQKQCCTLLKNELGIQIEENGFYIGLPLYAKERYFGILRILFHKRMRFIKDDGNGSFKLIEEYNDKLTYFYQLISLHLETLYYFEGYKKLSLINETISPPTISDLNKTCEILSEVVNCNGVIIRIYDESTFQPEVIGFTKTLSEYVAFIKSYIDDENPTINQFSVSLVELFRKDKSIIAVNFDTNNLITKTIKIFSIDEDNTIKESEMNYEISDLKSKSYLEKLRNLNIQQFSILPIPNVNESYITFSNTPNRKFISADVEMLILAVKGIGLEIKNLSDSQKIVELKEKLAQSESIRNVIHQVGAPLIGLLTHTSNIVENRVPESLVKERMYYILQMIKDSVRQIKRFQRIMDLETKPIIVNKKRIINLRKFLIGKSIAFQAITKSKGITIHVVSDEHSISDHVETDDELFDEVITVIVDNAVKYSFYSSQLKEKGIKYIENDIKSDGNILVYYLVTENQFMVKITNWGARIYQDEKNLIFEKHIRGRNAISFSPIGSGIGLFLAKKIITAMNGEIVVTSSGYKTEFAITFKY